MCFFVVFFWSGDFFCLERVFFFEDGVFFFLKRMFFFFEEDVFVVNLFIFEDCVFLLEIGVLNFAEVVSCLMMVFFLRGFFL